MFYILWLTNFLTLPIRYSDLFGLGIIMEICSGSGILPEILLSGH